MKQALSLLLLFMSLTCFSQIIFEPGYFITNSGTRTDCFIRNIAWKNNPVEFEYKLTEDGEIKTAKINEAVEFNVGAYRFIRFNVKIDRSSTTAAKLDTNREIKWNDETLYLKLLVGGTASLYQYEDSNLIKYFYSTGDHSAAVQLLYKEFLVDTRINVINQYKQELYNLMKEEIAPMERFERLQYKRDPLVDLFNDYNAKTGTPVTDYTRNQNKSSVNFKITPGIGFSSLEVSNVLISGSMFNFDNKVTYRLGFEIEYIMPFNNNKWALFIDPNYQSYSNSLSNKDHTITVDYNRIELPVGVRHYFFLNNDSKIFVNAAYVFDFNLGNSQMQFNESAPLEISKTSHYALGAGFGYNKFSIEARYNLPYGILDQYAYWTAEFSALNVILGYSFL